MKVYSKIDEIKLKNAKDNLVDGVLALQGGAFRGVYTSGVLDCLMENDINLNTCVGISAGALNGVNYISGNIGRSAKINLEYRHNPNWVGYKALKSDRGIVGFSFIFNKITDKLPFNYNRFYSKDRTLYALVTNINTGLQEAITNHQKELIFTAVKASASMPYISQPVKINDNYYLDGGCKFQSPIRFSLTLNKKIVYVATRDINYREDESRQTGRFNIYRKYPKFIKSLDESNKRYNQDSDLIDELVKEGKVFRIAPSKPINIKRFEGDMEKLGALYQLGYNDCKRNISALKKFLGMDYDRLVIGGTYRHFKGNYYKLKSVGFNSETKEEYVVYEELFHEQDTWILKKETFFSLVDKEKYPNASQKYRFELVEDLKN